MIRNLFTRSLPALSAHSAGPRHIVQLMCAALFAALIATAFPSAASAAVPNVRQSKTTSAYDSTPSKRISLPCRPGDVLIGWGATINGGERGTVAIQSVIPQRAINGSTPLGVVITAVELGTGTTKNWSVTGYATCAHIPATQGQVKFVSASSSSDSQAVKSVYADCPSDMKLIGGSGAVTTGVRNRVTLTWILPVEPSSGRQRVYAAASETSGGTTTSWSVTAYALCGKGSAFADAEYLYTATNNDSNNLKVTGALCPNGKKAFGAAAAIVGANDAVGLNVVHPNVSYGVAQATEIGNGTTQNWYLLAYAFCASY